LKTLERIQDDSLRQLFIETIKQDRDEDKILELKRDIRDNVKLLSELGLGTPIISAIKVFTVIPVDVITKPIMHKTVIDLWLKYATVQFQFDKQFKWPAGWFNPSEHV
jgi:hypothetical protein